MIVTRASCCLWAVGLLIVCRAPAAAADEPGLSRERARQAIAVAEDVYQSDAFWWKRSRQVADPTLPALTRLKDMLSAALQWIFERLRDLLGWLLEWLFGRGTATGDYSSGSLWWTLIVFALVAAITALYLFNRYRSNLLDRPQPAAAVDLQPERLAEPAELLRQARHELDAADYRQALRLALLSLIAWLRDRNLLHYHSSRTNREYQRDLANVPELAVVFREVAHPFERTWYGGRAAIRTDAERVYEVCRGLIMERERP